VIVIGRSIEQEMPCELVHTEKGGEVGSMHGRADADREREITSG
jgi:hypothetical protein